MTSDLLSRPTAPGRHRVAPGADHSLQASNATRNWGLTSSPRVTPCCLKKTNYPGQQLWASLLLQCLPPSSSTGPLSWPRIISPAHTHGLRFCRDVWFVCLRPPGQDSTGRVITDQLQCPHRPGAQTASPPGRAPTRVADPLPFCLGISKPINMSLMYLFPKAPREGGSEGGTRDPGSGLHSQSHCLVLHTD